MKQPHRATPKPVPNLNRKRNITLIALAVGITVLIYLISKASDYISFTPDLKKITPITVVTGRSIHDITTNYPAKYLGVNKQGLQGYGYYDKDTIATRRFFFKDGICIVEIIIPRDNQAIETYIHFLNRHGMVYEVPHAYFKGAWHIGDNGKITNVFFVCGEENEDGSPKEPYFVNTSLTLNEYLEGK